MAPKHTGASKVVDDDYEFPYRIPDRMSKWERLKLGIWNSSTNEFIGRDAKSWCGIITFYIVFYAALSAMFAICMYGMMSTLSEKYPTYQLDQSIIGTNPGLGFRPYSDDVEKTGSLIWYEASNKKNTAKWTGALDQFLSQYIEANKPGMHAKNKINCSDNQSVPDDKFCMVDINDFGPCSPEMGYSYNRSKPCVFIKLNRIINWVPEYYNDTNQLPEEMPDDLQGYIKGLQPTELNTVWVTCHGENPADRENIGEIRYIPKRGFPGYFFPYTNTPGYLSPIVALHFEKPALHTLINIECRAYAKNIEYKRALQHREGAVHFELMID